MDVNAITYLGHASTIVRLGGLNVYTDPHFGRRALWAKRHQEIIPPETLPPPDAIVISHAHYDHLDLHSFKYFSSRVPVFIPYGLKDFLARHIRNPLIELHPESEFLLQEKVTLCTIPVRHRGGRISGLRYRGSTGYLLKGEGGTVFFAGDTAYHPPLRQLSEKNSIDCALLPIGPCYPRWFMKWRHLNPEEVLRLFQEMGARTMIPIHWGVFRMGLEGAATPLHWLKNHLETSPLKERVTILQPGESWTLK